MAKRGKIRIESFSHKKGFVTFSNLTEKMVEKLLCMFEGSMWTRGNKSQTNFEAVRSYGPLPDPVEDAALTPFWEPFIKPPGRGIQHPLFYQPVDPALLPRSRISLYVRGLCANGYSLRLYQHEVWWLRKLGFMQLRTQRDKSGKFIELWYLPDLSVLRDGQFASAIKCATSEQALKLAFSRLETYLKGYVSYKSLEVTCACLHQGTED